MTYIENADDFMSFSRSINLIIYSRTQPWLIKETRKAHPRRSARLAGKRVAVK